MFIYFAESQCLLTPRFLQWTSLILILSFTLLMKCWSSLLYYLTNIPFTFKLSHWVLIIFCSRLMAYWPCIPILVITSVVFFRSISHYNLIPYARVHKFLSSVDLLPVSSFASATSHSCLAICCAAAPLPLTLVFLYISTIRKFPSPPPIPAQKTPHPFCTPLTSLNFQVPNLLQLYCIQVRIFGPNTTYT